MTARAGHPWARTGVAFGVGALLTMLVTVLSAAYPAWQPAVRSPAAHLVLETVVTMVTALVAVLSYGRYRRSASVRDLLLVHAMALLSLAALTFVLLPAIVGTDRGTPASAWGGLVLRVLGAAGLLAAALAPSRLRTGRFRPVADVGAVAGLVVIIWAGAVLLAEVLPDVVRVSTAIESTDVPPLAVAPGVLVLQVLVLLSFAGAAVAFTARSARASDDMLGWVGAAMALGAWSRLAYLSYPSQFSAWLYTGDLLRLGCYLLLVVGAVRELGTYWHVRTGIAVEAERRRLARDLHDGVVQELGYIRAQALRAGGSAVIASAADRAMFETRRAISALALDEDLPLGELLAVVAREAGERYGIAVHVEPEPGADLAGDHVNPATREALVRVAREAVINAARHARTSTPVRLRLAAGRLSVIDSGCGFDTEGHTGGGFGLVSMRERAAAVGASVEVRSRVGQGTTVEVVW
jgi:signal transduction histidine kinase